MIKTFSCFKSNAGKFVPSYLCVCVCVGVCVCVCERLKLIWERSPDLSAWLPCDDDPSLMVVIMTNDLIKVTLFRKHIGDPPNQH